MASISMSTPQFFSVPISEGGVTIRVLPEYSVLPPSVPSTSPTV